MNELRSFMPKINDPLQVMGVWRLAKNALLSKANPDCFAHVKPRSGFLGHTNRPYPRISNHGQTLMTIAQGPDHVEMFLIYVNRVKIRMTSDLVFQAGRKKIE
jgi:hypothetical protein